MEYYSKTPGKKTIRYATQEERDLATRASYLKNRYGLTPGEYQAMATGQNGLCKICGKPNTKGRKLYIDHNHKTGKVRGLLCEGCNFGLGGFKDDAMLLLEAVKYILNSDK